MTHDPVVEVEVPEEEPRTEDPEVEVPLADEKGERGLKSPGQNDKGTFQAMVEFKKTKNI